jgi:hypothetical protein
MIRLKSILEILQKEFVEGFDMEKFRNMKSFAKRVRYCNETLTRKASGSARVIYIIDDKKVLKLAKNEKGIAQNGVESDHMLNQWYGDIIAKVLESDDEDRWIVSEYAKKISPGRFKQLLGVSINQFHAYLTELHPNKKGGFYTEKIDDATRKILDVNNNEFMYDLVDMVVNWDMGIGDFSRISTFGEIDGRLVITDYGLTQDVYNTYYHKKPQGKY